MPPGGTQNSQPLCLPWALVVDTLSIPRQYLWAYTFPPHAQSSTHLLLEALPLPTQPWFPDLLELFTTLSGFWSRKPRLDRFHLEAAASCLNAVRRCLREAKFSRETADRIAAPQVPSTKYVYDGKWSIFCAWCGGQEADPFTASIPLIADFLTHFLPGQTASFRYSGRLFSHNCLCLQTHRPLDVDVGNDPALTTLLAIFSRECPKTCRFLPQWDLSLVLMALIRAPFEPPNWWLPSFCAGRCSSSLFLPHWPKEVHG